MSPSLDLLDEAPVVAPPKARPVAETMTASALLDLIGATPDPDYPGDYVGRCPFHGSFFGVIVHPDGLDFLLACKGRPDGCTSEIVLTAYSAPITSLAEVVIDVVVPASPKIPGNRFSASAITRGGLAFLPEPEPLIEATLDLHTVALLAGAPGIGKSFVALDWSASIATGTPWMGRPVRRGRVLYVVGEGAFGVHQRLAAWEEFHGVKIPDDSLFVIPEAVQIADGSIREEFIEYVTEEAFDLVVIDTLARSAVGLDENSAKEMGLFIDGADRVKRATSGTVLLVHHTGKDRKTVRGSSSLEGAMDTVYTMEGDSGRFALSRTKRKDGPRYDEKVLSLAEVEESCVVTEIGFERPSPEDERPRVVEAYTHIAKAHDDFAETKSVLKDTLVEAGFGRTQAYAMISRLAALDILRNVGTEKIPKLKIDRSGAHAEGFPLVEPFSFRSPASAPDLDGVV